MDSLELTEFSLFVSEEGNTVESEEERKLLEARSAKLRQLIGESGVLTQKLKTEWGDGGCTVRSANYIGPVWLGYLVQPSHVGPGIFLRNQFNTMAVDDLAPGVARSSAPMALTYVIVFLESEFQQT